MPTMNRDQHEDRLIEAMRREYGRECAGHEIAERVHGEFERLCHESKVTEFVPIIVERRVRQRLNEECVSDGHSVRPGVAPDELEELNRAS